MYLWVCLCLWMIPTSSPAQPDTMAIKIDTASQHEMPVFPGGPERLQAILAQNLVYPKNAKRDGIEGLVLVGFTIDTTGAVSGIHILRGIRKDIDQEAMRLAALLTGWQPGRLDGKPVPILYTLQVRFSMQDKRVVKRSAVKAGQ